MKQEQKRMSLKEIAQQLVVEQSVLKRWEKECAIEGKRSAGGQRSYGSQEVEKFMIIKELLYTKNNTLQQAKEYIQQMAEQEMSIVAALKSDSETSTQECRQRSESSEDAIAKITKQMIDLQKKLIQLRDLI